MPDPPVTRRQFLGSAAAVAATPLGASDPLPDAAPPHFPVAFALELLPPGVGKQLGAARFRDLTSGRCICSADSRWLIRYDDSECKGYELPTGRRVAFRTTPNSGWTESGTVVTTDSRLTVIEATEGAFRVRQYDLPSGVAHPPGQKIVKKGAVEAISNDGRIAVTQWTSDDGGEYEGVELATGRTKWVIGRKTPLPPRGIRIVGRFAHAGFVFPPEGADAGDDYPTMYDIETGREVRLEPPGKKVELSLPRWNWCSADQRRLLASVDVIGSDEERAVVWDTGSGRLLSSFALAGSDRVFGTTPDGNSFFGTVGEEEQLVLRDAATGKITRRYDVFDVDASESVVTPDGKTLFIARTDRARYDSRSGPDNTMIRLIDADSGLPLPQSPDPPGPLVRVWFPATNTAATAFRTKVGHVDYTFWDVPTARGRRVVDPTERNEAKQRDELEPANLVSPDGRQTLRPDGIRLTVVSTATGRTVASVSQPPVAAGRWFWLDAATVGVFSPDGLHVWKPDAGTVQMLPLALPGKRPLVWRWRAAIDGKRVGFQFFPDLAALVFQVGWVDVNGGKVTVSDQPHSGRGVGLAGSADGGRVAVGIDRPKSAERRASPEADWIAVHDLDGRRWLVNTPAAVPPFDLTGCGRTLAVRASGVSTDDDTPPTGPALELWEVVSGQRRTRYPVDSLPDDLRCSPCGRWVGTVRQDQPLYLWDVYGEVSDPRPEPKRAELPQLWTDLDSGNGEVAFRAVRTLVQHPAAAVQLLGAKLKPVSAPKADWAAERIEQLGHHDFRTRDTAERELAAVADVIADELRQAADVAETEEASERLDRLLVRASGKPFDEVRTVRAVEVLENATGEDTRAVLAKLAGGVPTALLTREASAALRRKDSGK